MANVFSLYLSTRGTELKATSAKPLLGVIFVNVSLNSLAFISGKDITTGAKGSNPTFNETLDLLIVNSETFTKSPFSFFASSNAFVIKGVSAI